MTYKSIEKALHEAERFSTAGRTVMMRLKEDGVKENVALYRDRIETAACRRASLDLTRALAEMRKPG